MGPPHALIAISACVGITDVPSPPLTSLQPFSLFTLDPPPALLTLHP